MRVHLIRRETLEAYGRLNPLARNALEVFLSKVRYADWGVPADIQKMFKDADIIGRGQTGSSSISMAIDIG
jgi:mRNA interferase HigB